MKDKQIAKILKKFRPKPDKNWQVLTLENFKKQVVIDNFYV